MGASSVSEHCCLLAIIKANQFLTPGNRGLENIAGKRLINQFNEVEVINYYLIYLLSIVEIRIMAKRKIYEQIQK